MRQAAENKGRKSRLSRTEPTEVYRFRMLVPKSGYRWLQDHETLPLRDSRLGPPPYLIPKGEIDDKGVRYAEVRSYFPLRSEPDLYCRFRELDLTEASILNFANQFGSINYSVAGVVEASTMMTWSAMSLAEWAQAILDLRLANHLFKCIVEDDQSTLSSYVEWHPRDFTVRVSLGVEGFRFLGKTDKRIKTKLADSHIRVFDQQVMPTENPHRLLSVGVNREDLRWPARLALRKMVNSQLQKLCHPTLFLDKGRGLEGHFTPTNLLGCMWLQLYFAVIGRSKLRRCKLCELEFDATRFRRNKTVHDKCSYYARQRRYDAKRRGVAGDLEGAPREER